MCLIVVEPAKVKKPLTAQEFDTCKLLHPDGFGIAYVAKSSGKFKSRNS